MDDLISRSALLEKLRFAEEHGNGFGLAFPIELVEVSHAVDAVPVVRCKDCVWGIVSARNPLIKWCNKHATHFRDNDFCSYGERRADDGKL